MTDSKIPSYDTPFDDIQKKRDKEKIKLLLNKIKQNKGEEGISQQLAKQKNNVFFQSICSMQLRAGKLNDSLERSAVM